MVIPLYVDAVVHPLTRRTCFDSRVLLSTKRVCARVYKRDARVEGQKMFKTMWILCGT